MRAFGATLFRHKYPTTLALLKEPRARDMIRIDVGFKSVEKLKLELFHQRRVTACMLEYGINEHRLMAVFIAKKISVGAGCWIK